MNDETGKDQRTEDVAGIDLVERIKELIAEGNASSIRVLTEDGKIVVEIPLTAGAITGGVVVLAAPWLAILGALAVLVARAKIEIVRDPPTDTPTGPDPDPA